MRSRFLGKLFASYALVVVMGGVLVGAFAFHWTEQSERGAIEESLAAQARLLADAVAPALRDAAAPGFDAAGFEARIEALGRSTGSRLTATLLHEMKRRGARYGIVSMCIGGGQGAAGLFELAK